MNVIERMQDTIKNLLDTEVHIDFTEESEACYSLSTVSDTKLKQDIIGNQTRMNSMELSMTKLSPMDYDRLNNSSFLLNLGYELETYKGLEITTTIQGQERSGHIKSISVSNGQPFYTSEDRQYITYLIQIKVVYDLRK